MFCFVALGLKQLALALHRRCFGGRLKRAGSGLDRRVFTQFVISASATLFCFPAAAFASAVTAPVEELYAVLPQIMQAGRATPFRRRYEMLAPVIDQVFDLETILRVAVGSQWADIPADQQTALKEAFRRYTVATWVSNFDSFSGQRFEVQPNSTPVGAYQTVQTRVLPASGEPHRLDYVMRPIGTAWKAMDVLAEGSISRVATQRSEIRSVLGAGGPPALLDRLRKKTGEISGWQLP